MILGAEGVDLVGHGDEAVFGVIDGNLDAFDEEVVHAASKASAFGLKGTDLAAEVVGFAAQFGEAHILFGGGHVFGGASMNLADCSAFVKPLSTEGLRPSFKGLGF